MEFKEIPKKYKQEAQKQGRIVKIYYDSKTYDEKNASLKKDANVYLPYEYDQCKEKKYNVLYLMHGGGGNADELFYHKDIKTGLKLLLDNFFEKGYVEPVIVVTPSFFFEGNEEARVEIEPACRLTHRFPKEMSCDLIDAVNENFRVNNTREARAFGGFSMGAETTWSVFSECVKDIKYFLPMSGDYWIRGLKGGKDYPKETVDGLIGKLKERNVKPEDFIIYACTGDEDIAYDAMDPMLQEMKTRTDWFQYSDDPGEGNFHYCLKKKGIHTYIDCFEYIYNVLPYLFQ